MNGYLQGALKQSNYGKIFRTRNLRRGQMAVSKG